MTNKIKKIIRYSLFFLVFVLSLLISYFIFSKKVEARTNDLKLKVIKECNIYYSGDSCISNLDLTNENKELDGLSFLEVKYEGECINKKFDGKGLETKLFISDKWLNFSNWDKGIASTETFKIKEGKSKAVFNADSSINLCPGKYTFSLEIRGTETNEKEKHRTSVGSSSFSQYSSNYLLELQIQIIKLKIQILTILIQLQQAGHFIFQNRF
jgi:hypothetical protein